MPSSLLCGVRRSLLGRAKFTPRSIPDLVLWLDPTYGLYQETTGASATTPAVADGDPVGTWKARTGQYFTAPSTATRPTRQTDGLAPDAVDDKLSTASGLALTGDFTFWVSGQASAASVWPALAGSADSSVALRFSDNTIYATSSTGLQNNKITSYTPAGAFHIRVRRTGSTVNVAASGAAEQTELTVTGDFNLDTLFVRPTVAQRNSDATNRYATMLVYSRYLTASEIARVENYLGNL